MSNFLPPFLATDRRASRPGCRSDWMVLYQRRDDAAVPFTHLAWYAKRLPEAIVRDLDGGGSGTKSRLRVDPLGSDQHGGAAFVGHHAVVGVPVVVRSAGGGEHSAKE